MPLSIIINPCQSLLLCRGSTSSTFLEFVAWDGCALIFSRLDNPANKPSIVGYSNYTDEGFPIPRPLKYSCSGLSGRQ